MGIGDSITTVSCLAGTMFALPAMLLLFNLTFWRMTGAAAARLERGLILPFIVGLFPAGLIGGFSVLLISVGSVAQFCGTIFMLGLFLWGFIGLSAVAQMLGARLGEFAGRPENAFIEAIAGAGILTFAIAFPLLGWLVILPMSLICGMGATILGTVNRLMARSEATFQAKRSEVAAGAA